MTTIAAEVTIGLGLASTTGRLVTLRKGATGSKAGTSLTTLCPDCVDEAKAAAGIVTLLSGAPAPLQVGPGAKVSQFYVCEAGHKPGEQHGYTTKECRKGAALGRGKNVNGYVPVDGDEVREVKVSDLAEGHLDLSVHPAAEVESQTWPSGTFYLFQPKVADPFYAVLADRLNRVNDLALVGLFNLKNAERLYRLVGYKGGIVFQELARPQDLEQVAPEAVVPLEQYQQLLEDLVKAVNEDFDADAYAPAAAERLRALIAAKVGEQPTPAEARKEAAEDSLLASLLASIEAAKAAKAA